MRNKNNNPPQGRKGRPRTGARTGPDDTSRTSARHRNGGAGIGCRRGCRSHDGGCVWRSDDQLRGAPPTFPSHHSRRNQGNRALASAARAEESIQEREDGAGAGSSSSPACSCLRSHGASNAAATTRPPPHLHPSRHSPQQTLVHNRGSQGKTRPNGGGRACCVYRGQTSPCYGWAQRCGYPLHYYKTT